MQRTRSLLLSITWLLAVAVASGPVAAQAPDAKRPSLPTSTVVVAPPGVEAAAPVDVTVSAAATSTPEQRTLLLTAAKARVGEETVNVSVNGDGLRFRPPARTSVGVTNVELLGKDGGVLVTFGLNYTRNAPAPAPPTPDAPPTVSQVEEVRRTRLSDSYWYYLLITLLFAAIVLPFAMAISASVYRGQSELNADSRPLGLPVGSVRSILAYSLIGYLGFYVLTSVLSVSRFDPPEFLLGIVATVIGFYFGSRSGEDAETRASRTGTVRGIVQQGAGPVRGALVSFKRAADNVEAYTRITDVEGRFELPGALPGKYLVKASVAGAAPSDEQQVNVLPGSDHEVLLLSKAAAPPPQAPPKP